MIDLDKLVPGKAKALDSCWKAATREGFNLNDSAELGDFTTAYMAALASDEVRALVEIAKAAKDYTQKLRAFEGSPAFTLERVDAEFDARLAVGSLVALIERNLLPAQPERTP